MRGFSTNLGTGKVGIGTTSPGAKLEVAGASSSPIGIKISGTNNHLQFHDTGGGADWYRYMTGGDGVLHFYHSGDKLVFDNSGNVGIGTTTPGSKLDVEGNVSIGATYSGTTAGPTNGVIIEGKAGIGTTSPQSKLDVEGGVSIGATYSGTTAAPTDGAIIEGKTGIGASTPASKLEVAGSSGFFVGIKIDGTGNHLQFHDTGGGTDWYTYMTGGDGVLRFYSSADSNTNNNYLYTINAINGVVISNPTFPVFANPYNLIEFKCDNSSGSLYALHWGAIDEFTEIEEVYNTNSLAIYPNPSNKTFNISLPVQQTFNLQVTDVAGRIVYYRNNATGSITVDANSFSSGVYLVRALSERFVLTEKLIKE